MPEEKAKSSPLSSRATGLQSSMSPRQGYSLRPVPWQRRHSSKDPSDDIVSLRGPRALPTSPNLLGQAEATNQKIVLAEFTPLNY